MRRHSHLAGATLVSALATLALAPPATALVSFAAERAFPAGDAQTVALGDFNKDGTLDAATADANTQSASVLLGDGTGGFGATTSYVVTGTPHDIQTADFTGDGNLDLAVSGQNSGSVRILPGAGNGTFGAPIDVAAAPGPYALGVADFNGDGKADMVVSDSAAPSPRVDVLLGNGDGTFGARIEYLVPDQPDDLTVADVNGDNRLDLVTGGGDPGSVSVLLGNGSGGFATADSRPRSADVNGVAIADFNADQNADLAYGLGGVGVGVELGDGTGAFGARTDFAASSAFPGAVVAQDLDGDGIADLALSGGDLTVLRGLGDGTFEPPASFQSGGVNLALGDLNADGRPDAVIAANQNLRARLNTSPSPGPPPLPAPVVARTANVAPVKGTVLVKQPGTRRFIRLEEGAQIRIGSEVDVTKGSVRLTSAAGGGKTQSGVFRGGLFKLGQKKGPRPITELKLTAKLRCVKSRGPVQTSAKARRSRQLFGNARGRFRTRGRNSTATIRGTKWLVKDSCKGTLTVSQQGTVVVRDLVKRRTVTLKSGQRYLARRGNR